MICYDDIVNLVEVLSSRRDPYDHHGPRVREMTERMALALDMSANESQLMMIGASLHDIGKFLVPDDVLNVPRRLTKNEMALVKVHPLEGWKMINELDYDPIVQDIILHHHENFDGSGYPDRLKGEEITIHARIVAIADRFDAMSSRRPYRQGLSIAEIKRQMENESGWAFDPQILDVFFEKIVNDG
ncbi:MAG TPA: HD domain-containing phosphohydrolase [Anaerolineales bacterium]|nr:HD domain-containing phosphohydrolase [Anaerolineales bacterium]